MRQVFTSARLENVEAVAKMLEDDGIEVRITNGRSYKGAVRRNFSYREGGNEGPQPAVWIVKSEDQPRARAILREHGLIGSTRAPGDSYLAPTFIDVQPAKPIRAPQSRAFKLKVGMLLVIAAIIALIMFQTLQQKDAQPSATAQPGLAPVPESLARAIFVNQIAATDAQVACLTIDGKDASPALIETLARPNLDVVPGSHCVRVATEGSGSYARASHSPALLVEINGFRRGTGDSGQIQFSAYRHRMRATYKTLEVQQTDGQWRIVRVLKHVSA
ncbi:hypothetical protein IP90_03241 [Luteimonas cucumeris]|uniref:Signal transducing protein n=1 Tax=Luteimonas cucumeris TaxID=985012 RepID=A0A562KUK3_9GAMM|nr:DUF2007 domain-containing protein [Luteimonas cucumeris]TWH99062.1 hypothetical protein IP90_03241 [Luteimonas cucumeris]